MPEETVPASPAPQEPVFKSKIKALPVAVDHTLTELRFYFGADHFKLKAKSKITGKDYELAKLCRVGSEQEEREISLNFAALAIAMPDLLTAAKMLRAASTDEQTNAFFDAALARATRLTPTEGEVSPTMAKIAAQAKTIGDIADEMMGG
jgi:hypothetical protein